jgi:hypothetical protein
MIRALIKYFLSPCILLLSGHGVLHAHTNQDCIYYPSITIKALERSAHAGFTIVQNSLNPMIWSVSSGKETENYDPKDLLVYDDNDDKSASFKKRLRSRNTSASILYAQTPGHFFIYSKKILPFNMKFSDTSSHRYLTFQVFRI